jgi:DNA-directed RNA polymerase specialized sigma subunit
MVDAVDTGRLEGRQGSGHGTGQVEVEKSPVLEVLREQLREKDRQIAELHVLLRETQGQIERLLPAHISQPETQMLKKRHWWWPF